MLVDHLADAVLQQNHELVKGVDLPLQLDAVDQVDRYRNPLLAQGVEERVLQGLAFGHVFSLFFRFVLFVGTALELSVFPRSSKLMCPIKTVAPTPTS